MNYKKYGIFFSLCFFIGCSNKERKVEQTKVSFEKEIFDFGNVSFEEDVPIKIKFLNTGKNSMIIENVKTSCGCTVPKLKKKVIKSNEYGYIDVTVSPTTRGKFSSSVYVFYNGPNSPKKIRIKGEIDYLDLLEE